MANATNTGLTFADMAAAAPVTAKYIKGSLTLLEKESEVSDVLKFISLGGQLTATVPRLNPDAVGSVYYRNIDGKYTFSKSSLEKYTEPTAFVTSAFTIDTVTQNDPSFTLFKPATTNLTAFAGQTARELMDAMVNGDPVTQYQTDPDSLPLYRVPGIRYRLQQGLNGIDTGAYKDSSSWHSGGIDLTSLGSTMANDMVDALNEQIALIEPDFMLMNYRTSTLLARTLRVGNMLQTTKDQYDREFNTYKGVKIIVPKLKQAARTERNVTDTTNWIMPYEDSSGNRSPSASAGSRYASIFMVRANTTDGFTGFTVNGMTQRGPEKLPLPAETLAYAMQYGFGFGTLGIRCIGGIYDIKIG